MENETVDDELAESEPQPKPYRVIGRLSVDDVSTDGVVFIADPVRARQLVRSRLIDPIRSEPEPDPIPKPKPAPRGARQATDKEA